MFKKNIAALVCYVMIIEALSPAFAVFHTVGEVAHNLDDINQYKSYPAPLRFVISEDTAAGIFHYAKSENGTMCLLLGLRDDEDTWCAFGGKSDPVDETLANTAAREVDEESNHIFTTNPWCLRNLPFTDVYFPDHPKSKSGRLYYRSYWQPVQMVNTGTLMQRMKESSAHHYQEYRDFKWIPVASITAALKAENDTISLDGTTIKLFADMVTTLKTESAQHFLNHLSDNASPLSMLASKTRRYANKLYITGASGNVDTTPITWEWDAKAELERSCNTIPFGRDAMGRKGLFIRIPKARQSTKDFFSYDSDTGKFVKGAVATENTFNFNVSTGTLDRYDVAFVEYNKAHQHRVFCGAIAAHMAAMAEIKKVFKVKKIGSDNHSVATVDKDVKVNAQDPRWNPTTTFTPSRIHIAAALGDQHKRASDFANSNDPQRDADITNLKQFMERFHRDEFRVVEQDAKTESESDTKKNSSKLIDITDEDFELLHRLLSKSPLNPDNWPEFFHAGREDIGALYDTFTAMMESLYGTDHQANYQIRGTDIYFRKSDGSYYKDMAEVRSLRGDDDYQNRRSDIVLSANLALMASRKTTVGSTFSPELLFRNKNIEPIDVLRIFDETTALHGMTPNYHELSSLFQQFKANNQKPNSFMLRIFINPKILDHLTYASLSLGVPHTQDALQSDKTRGENKDDILYYLQHIQELGTKLSKDTKEVSSHYHLFPQVRIYLKPDVMGDSSMVRVERVNRYPLSKKDEEAYLQEISKAMIAINGDWLNKKTTVNSDPSQDATIKRLYKYAYKGLTGEDATEKFSTHSLIHLIKNGQVDAAMQFLTSFPDCIKETTISPPVLVKTALRASQVAMLEYLVNKFSPEKGLQGLMTFKEFLPQMNRIDDSMLSYCIDVFKDDVSNSTYKAKKFWLGELLNSRNGSSTTLLEAFSPFIQGDLARNLPTIILEKSRYISESTIAQLLHLVEMKVAAPQDIFKTFADYVLTQKQHDLNYCVNDSKALAELYKHPEVNVTVRNPKTGRPYIFDIIKSFGLYYSGATEVLRQKNVLDVTTDTGQNLLQFCEETYLKGGFMCNHANYDSLLNEINRAYQTGEIAAEHYPRFEEVVMYFYNSVPTVPPDLTPEISNWINSLLQLKDKINSESSLYEKDQAFSQRVVDSCPHPALIPTNWQFPVNVIPIWNAFTGRKRTMEEWIKNVRSLHSPKEPAPREEDVKEQEEASIPKKAMELLAKAPSQYLAKEYTGLFLTVPGIDVHKVITKIYGDTKSFLTETKSINAYSPHGLNTYCFLGYFLNTYHLIPTVINLLNDKELPTLFDPQIGINMESVLKSIEEKTAKRLAEGHASILLRNTREQQFLKDALKYLPYSERKEFIIKNMQKIIGARHYLDHEPIFIGLFSDAENFPLLNEIFQQATAENFSLPDETNLLDRLSEEDIPANIKDFLMQQKVVQDYLSQKSA